MIDIYENSDGSWSVYVFSWYCGRRRILQDARWLGMGIAPGNEPQVHPYR